MGAVPVVRAYLLGLHYLALGRIKIAEAQPGVIDRRYLLLRYAALPEEVLEYRLHLATVVASFMLNL